MLKLERIEFQLISIEGRILPNIPDRNIPLEIESRHSYEIDFHKNSPVQRIYLRTIASPIPPALFEIEMEHRIEFEGSEPMSKEVIESIAYDLCDGLGTQMSHLISILTFELIGTHIIVPPHLNKEKFEPAKK